MVPKFRAFWAKRACVYMLIMEFDYPKSCKIRQIRTMPKFLICRAFLIFIYAFCYSKQKFDKYDVSFFLTLCCIKCLRYIICIIRVWVQKGPRNFRTYLLLHTTYILISLINLHVLRTGAWAEQSPNLWT